MSVNVFLGKKSLISRAAKKLDYLNQKWCHGPPPPYISNSTSPPFPLDSDKDEYKNIRMKSVKSEGRIRTKGNTEWRG